MNILIAGATGFLGRPISGELLRGGHAVTAISRDAHRAAQVFPAKVTTIAWAEDQLRRAAEAADAVINLVGEPIAEKRWTAAVKERLRSSRIDSTRALVRAMRASGRRNQILVNASAVGYYGDQGDNEVTEETPPGRGFLAELCVEWEAEARKAEEEGARVVLARTGIVLAEEGGALERMLTPFKLGVGGPIGSGRQWLPWVHLADVVSMFVWLTEQDEARGPFNVTAPEPVTMRAFAHALGKALHRPAVMPVPGMALRLLLGEIAESLLTGQKALPHAAERLGFAWSYPTLEQALQNLVGRGETPE